MTTIYHNPRCTKSRQALELLESKGEDINIIKYLDEVPSEKELIKVIRLLGIAPIELVRKNEAIWKEQFKGKELTDVAVISAMIANPKLIERPIIIKEGKAVIGRPTERILEIL